MEAPTGSLPPITFETSPERYHHWKLAFDGPIARLTMQVAEDQPLRPGYQLKLNSYDLGVDIELHDILQRIRFERPDVGAVVITSAKNRIFCSGANIYMLGQSSHAWKVNFCKFTNETRNGIEDASRHSGLKFIAACNGTTAGGGYELALACDEIALVDDRSSAVSLPEVPLLGVLPGTGGLTRLTDKRRVRRDHADIFCTSPDGVKGARAKEWRLADHIVRTQEFGDYVRKRAVALAEQSDRPADGEGVKLMPLEREMEADAIRYRHVAIVIDRATRTATFTATAPTDVDSMLRFARELDDAILHMRTNELEIGLWLFKTAGDPNTLAQLDHYILDHQDDWYVREVLGMMRRTLQRLEVSSRSIFSIVTPGSCFAGTFLELALASDRIYMLQTEEDEPSASLMLSPINFGSLPTVSGQSRLAARFYDDAAAIDALREEIGVTISAVEAVAVGLVTDAPDALDWDDELRQAMESRVALSPDALTGMEANLRFGPSENQATRIFGRLSAWQNWIFIRPNATGEKGALKVYGSGAQPKFDWDRV